MTTKLFGQPVLRSEDPRLVTGNGRYLDDLGHDALEVAFVRSPHAHARIVDIDVTDALDVDGLVAIYTYDDLAADQDERGSRVAEPLPLLIPHPTLTHGRTQYALAKDEVNYVGEAIVMVVAVQPLHRRGRGGPDPGRLRVPARGGGRRGRPGGGAPRPRRRAGQRRGPHGPGDAATPTPPSTRRPTGSSWSSPSSAARRCRWRARASCASGTPTTGR